MKTLINTRIILLAASLALCCSCKKEHIVSLSVSVASFQFSANETSTKTATVSTKADWYASPSAQWLLVERDGKTLSVTPTGLNNEDAERSAMVVVAAGNSEPVLISVTQSVTKASLSATPTALSFGATETAPKSVTVTSNAQLWSAISTDAWIRCEQDANVVRIAPTGSNTTSSERSGTVMIRAGNAAPINVSVTQSRSGGTSNTLSVSPTSITFAATETATRTATVTTNASSWSANTTASWLSLSQSGNSLRITPTGANTSTAQRSATITVTAGSANSVAVQVIQSGTSTSTTLNFTDIVNSTYLATGTPAAGVSNPAPGSWAGTLSANAAYSYYTITNWANIIGYPLWIDYEGGKLYLDLSSVVYSTADLDYYFVVGYLEGTTFTSKASSYKYEVTYNKTTRTLDLSGTVDGHVAQVAIRGVNKTTQAGTVYTNSVVANAKFVLTPTGSAPASIETKSPSFSGKSGKVITAPEEKTPVKEFIR